MKTLYIAIAMWILFILIPPDNKPDLKCYKKVDIYQEKISYLFSDLRCFWNNISLNLETRYKNLQNNWNEVKWNIESISKVNKIQKMDVWDTDWIKEVLNVKSSSINDLSKDTLHELWIDKNDLNQKLSSQEYNNLFNDLSE